MGSRKIRTVLFIVSAMVLFSQGCKGGGPVQKMNAPKHKLDYSIYNPEGSGGAGGQYTIGVRDEIEIAVWRCPELGRTVVVRPEDGMVTFPLVGDVKAAGSTPKELARNISNALVPYVKEPRVAVGVKKFGDKKVFLLGEVLMQGTYRLERGDRIIDLVTRAGGFTQNAVPACTYIVRGGYDDHSMIHVNLERLIQGGDVSQNVYLLEGDIVYVPEIYIERYNYVLRKIFPTLFFAEKMGELKRNIMSGDYDWSDVWRKMKGVDGYTQPRTGT